MTNEDIALIDAAGSDDNMELTKNEALVLVGHNAECIRNLVTRQSIDVLASDDFGRRVRVHVNRLLEHLRDYERTNQPALLP